VIYYYLLIFVSCSFFYLFSFVLHLFYSLCFLFLIFIYFLSFCFTFPFFRYLCICFLYYLSFCPSLCYSICFFPLFFLGVYDLLSFLLFRIYASFNIYFSTSSPLSFRRWNNHILSSVPDSILFSFHIEFLINSMSFTQSLVPAAVT
jgi:hypothetical protein